MNEFIEKNSRLLRMYCLVVRTIGWFLLAGGAMWLTYGFSGVYIIHNKTQHQEAMKAMTLGCFTLACDFIIPGLLAFAISQLLIYITRPEGKAGLMLRIADKLCYCYAAFIFIQTFRTSLLVINKASETSQLYNLFFGQALLSIPIIAKILVLIGAGVIIRRLLPVIDESKTLV